MADVPENLTLGLLRDIRAAQDAQTGVLGQHTASLTRLEKRVEDLYTMSTHTLGVAVTAHERHEALETRMDQLSERVPRLETKAAE